MRYFILLTLLIFSACSFQQRSDKEIIFRIVNNNGKPVTLNLRSPQQNNIQNKRPIQKKMDSIGDPYYSNGAAESEGINIGTQISPTYKQPNPSYRRLNQDIQSPKELKHLSNLANAQETIAEQPKPIPQPRATPFVGLEEINFNESQNMPKVGNILLDKQNVSINTTLRQPRYQAQTTTPKQRPQNLTLPETKYTILPEPKPIAITKNNIAQPTTASPTPFSPPSTNNTILPLQETPEISTTKTEPKALKYYVNFGTFQRRENAIKMKTSMEKILNIPIDLTLNESKNKFQLMVGPFFSYRDAELIFDKAIDEGYYDVTIINIEYEK